MASHKIRGQDIDYSDERASDNANEDPRSPAAKAYADQLNDRLTNLQFEEGNTRDIAQRALSGSEEAKKLAAKAGEDAAAGSARADAAHTTADKACLVYNQC